MSTAAPTIAGLQARVLGDESTGYRIAVACGACTIAVSSNSGALIEKLEDYFSPFLVQTDAQANTQADTPADIRITALQMPEPDLGLDFIDWPREAGKTGRKDTYIDLADGRALRKVKTGMQYLIGADGMMIFGDCLTYDNQVVNFVVAQQINHAMNRGWALCHAAGVARSGRGLAICAFSGGGKSTLALHMMNRGLDFVSNDRMLIAKAQLGATMLGVPKHPRINPGTIVNNAALAPLLPAADKARIAAMPAEDVWTLEEKYDARIDRLYGDGRFQLSARMDAMLILNWTRTSDEPTRFHEVDIAARSDLLDAVMKSPGPFYTHADAAVPQGIAVPDPDDYLPLLGRVPVFEATGRVDFDAAVSYFSAFLDL